MTRNRPVVGGLQAHYRAARAAIALGDFARAAEACAGGLRVAPDAPELASLRDTVAERAAAKQARLHCPERV